jgi:hypothetical protein
MVEQKRMKHATSCDSAESTSTSLANVGMPMKRPTGRANFQSSSPSLAMTPFSASGFEAVIECV